MTETQRDRLQEHIEWLSEVGALPIVDELAGPFEEAFELLNS